MPNRAGIKYFLFGVFLVVIGMIGMTVLIFNFVGQPHFFDSIRDRYKTEQSRIAINSLEQALETKDYKLCLNAYEPDFCIRTVARITGDSEVCKEITNQERSEKCIALIAGDTKNYELCSKIVNHDIKNYCQRLLATQTLNAAICDELPETLAAYTRDKCFFDMAAAKKSADLCEKSGDLKEKCYYRLAVATKNLETCGLIKDNDLRDFCFFYNSVHVSQVRPCEKIERDPLATLCPALASLNDQYCELLKDYRLKNLCYQQIALKADDAELCKGDKTCITKIASRNHSPELCDQISFEQYKSDCKTTVATTNHDESICHGMDKNPKEYCFYYLALKTGDAAYCENIENKNEDMIYEMVLEIFGRERQYELTRSYCISQVARYKPDIEVCDHIRSNAGKENCRTSALSGIIKLNKDPQLCESVGSFYDEMKCYYSTAVNTKDYRLCQKIKEVKLDAPYSREEWVLSYQAENLQACYDKLLSHFENEYLKTHAHVDELAEGKKLPEDPIEFTVQQDDVAPRLAEKALNIFLADMTELESSEIGFEITLGHRVYIEDYLARQIKPEGHIYPGEKISFPRKLIMESVQISNQLTPAELTYISKYSISTLKPGFDLLQEGYLSYCNFKNELSYYSRPDDKKLNLIICQITISGDYSLCEQVTEQVTRRKCHKWIIENTSNYKVCENFQEKRNRNFCYGNFAESLEDVDICYNLETVVGIDFCIRSIARKRPDPALCQLIQEEIHRGGCYEAVALDREDVSFCEKIIDANTRTWCLIHLAKKIDDVSLCERIKEDTPLITENFKYNCYTGYYKDNINLFRKDNCDELSGFRRDYCYLYKVSMDGDLKKCDQIEIEEIKDYCRYEALVFRSDPRCELIKSWAYRNECYLKVARSIKDPTLCNKISNNDYMVDQCFKGIR